ncbi:hypothetical protein [Mycoplasma hafezii]|uniref:hypothetical protein n=1 Tax=Mycoplasma hafezii TaxID=525886 RepID=UPI003CF64994
MLDKSIDKINNWTITPRNLFINYTNDLGGSYFLSSDIKDSYSSTWSANYEFRVDEDFVMHKNWKLLEQRASAYGENSVVVEMGEGVGTKGNVIWNNIEKSLTYTVNEFPFLVYIPLFGEDKNNVLGFMELSTQEYNSPAEYTIKHTEKTISISKDSGPALDLQNELEYVRTIWKPNTVDNHQFYGWYSDESDGVEFDADFHRVRADFNSAILVPKFGNINLVK